MCPQNKWAPDPWQKKIPPLEPSLKILPQKNPPFLENKFFTGEQPFLPQKGPLLGVWGEPPLKNHNLLTECPQKIPETKGEISPKLKKGPPTSKNFDPQKFPKRAFKGK